MHRHIFILTFILLIAAAGCSSSSNPAVPAGDTSPTNTETQGGFPGTIFTSDSSGTTGNMILGAYEGVINLETLEYDFVPMRTSSAIGDSFQVDLTYFLDGVPCGNCLRIGQIKLDDDSNLEINFEAQHPFPGSGPRLDLPVFDVRGDLVNKDPNVTPFTRVLSDLDADGVPETPVAADVDFLLNADGYSTFFDAVSEDYLGLNIPGNLTPYRLFFVDPTQGNFNKFHPNGVENINQPRGHNVFAQGVEFNDNGASQMYKVKAGPGATLNFVFILEAAYGQSATFAKTINNPGQPGARNSPKFFVPEFNRKEAWKVETEIIQNRLVPFDITSSATIQVTACDWQAGVVPTGDFGPDGALDDIRTTSDVAAVQMDIPGILNDLKVQAKTDGSGLGNDTVPYVWEFTFTNERAAKPGDYAGIIAVRDEIGPLLDGHTPPFAVKQDTKPVDYRDFATYKTFTIRIAGLIGNFQADPFRKNLDIVTGKTHPTSDAVELDLAVVENDNEDIKGVYIPDASGGIARYDFNYIDAVFHGPGILPPNSTGTHPNPDVAMPIRRLAANLKGTAVVCYNDAFESFQPDPPNEPILPAGNIIRVFYSVIPPPEPPYDMLFPLTPFAGYYMPDSDDPATDTINEFQVEDPLPIEAWDSFNGHMGAVWETTKLVNPATGLYDVIYFGFSLIYSINPADPPEVSPDYSINLTGIPANDIKGVDESDEGYLYIGMSGTDTPMGGSIIYAVNAADPSGNPQYGYIITSGKVIDVELLPYDDTMPRTINNFVQNSPILAVLTDASTIEIINTEDGRVMQLIDGVADGTISGTPKHLDVGDNTFTIHVTHLEGTTPRVTVYTLR